MLLMELFRYQAREPRWVTVIPFPMTVHMQGVYTQEKESQGEIFQNAAGENTSELKVYGCGNLHVSREMHVSRAQLQILLPDDRLWAFHSGNSQK